MRSSARSSRSGELERNSRTSQDVTEQYYDIEARIKNKKAEEKTITKILEERTGKLEEVLKVEVELSRVRGEIEQLEGKIRVLENLSALATLTVNVREREKFQPPPPVAADFPTQIARTWSASVQALVDRLKAITLWAVDWAIWLPLLIVSAVPCVDPRALADPPLPPQPPAPDRAGPDSDRPAPRSFGRSVSQTATEKGRSLTRAGRHQPAKTRWPACKRAIATAADVLLANST